MDKIITEFIQVLNKENELLDNLLGISEEKKGIIILGKIKELEKITQKESIVAANLEKTEMARLKIHQKIARQWEIPIQELTASVIIEKSQVSLSLLSDQLKLAIDHMEATIGRLREINRENNELIGASLEYVDNMQALLMGDTSGTYSEKGAQVSESNSRPTFRMIDKKA